MSTLSEFSTWNENSYNKQINRIGEVKFTLEQEELKLKEISIQGAKIWRNLPQNKKDVVIEESPEKAALLDDAVLLIPEEIEEVAEEEVQVETI